MVMNCSLRELVVAGRGPVPQNHARGGYRQDGSAQSLACPYVAGVTKIVCPGGCKKDALRIGTGADPAQRPFLVHGQIVPQKCCETLDAVL